MRNNIKTLVLSFALSIYSMTSFAANSGEEDFIAMVDPAGPGGDPGAPIGDYIFPMILAALIFGYRIVLKKKNGPHKFNKI
jgi:hypothetical protein